MNKSNKNDPSTRPQTGEKNEKMKNMKTYKNENIQKLIIFEGFMQNGFQNRNQRIFLRRKSCAKIDFRYFLKNMIFGINVSFF